MNPSHTFSINKGNHLNCKSMNRALGGTAIFAVFTIMLLSSTPQAYADEICANTILGGEFELNIIVPSGSWCQLEGALVKGNVITEENTSLDVFDSIIEGNIQGPVNGGGPEEVYISEPSLVKGNVLINGVVLIEGVDGGTATVESNVISHGDGFFRIWEALIKGNIDAEQKTVVDIFGTKAESNILALNNIGTSITIESNLVSGNIQVQNNDGPSVDVDSNEVSGNIQVTDNSNSPSVVVNSNEISNNLQISTSGPNCTHSGNIVSGTETITECQAV